MTSIHNNYFFKAKITFKNKKNPSEYVDYSFTNRNINITADFLPYSYPLLNSIEGLGLSIGQSGIPTKVSGSISIDDYIGSIGEEKRVLDLLAEYTPVNQTVEVYIAKTQKNPSTISWVKIWKGICNRASRDISGSQSLTFDVESLGLPQTLLTKEITDEGGDSEIDNSVGLILPLVLGGTIGGEPYVPAIQVNDGTSADFYFATELHSNHLVGSYYGGTSHIYDLFVKDDEGNYRKILGESISIFDNGTADNANYPTPQGLTERAYVIPSGFSNYSYMTCGGYWIFKGQNNGSITPIGNLYFSLWELSDTDGFLYPSKLVANAVVKKSDYLTEVRSNSNFKVEFGWDKAVVLKIDGRAPVCAGYAISYRQDRYDTASTDFVDSGRTAPVTNRMVWTRRTSAPTGTENTEWGEATLVNETATFGLHAIDFTRLIGTNVEKGLRLAGVRASNLFEGVVSAPSLKLDIVVPSLGLFEIPTSIGASTITTPGEAIRRPHEVIRLITRNYTENTYPIPTWEDSTDWDFDTYASYYNEIFNANSRWARYVSGYSDSRVTLEELLQQLSKELLIKIIQLNSGKFAVWAWGANYPVKRVFTDEDVNILNYRILDTSSVVNNITVGYDKGALVNESARLSVPKTTDSFKRTFSTSKLSAYIRSKLSDNSQSLYGEKNLEELNLNWIGDPQSISVMTEYYLSNFDHPHALVQIEVPFFENSDIELLDIVEILSTTLPASGGSSSNARNPQYDGEEFKIYQSKFNKRAQRYRCQVVSKTADWASGQLPKSTLEVRIIKPYHENEIT